MTRRIEPVETYASLFRWAATYSLLLTDDVLHVVRLGPAMGGVGGAERDFEPNHEKTTNI